jgi:hypothetical protein
MRPSQTPRRGDPLAWGTANIRNTKICLASFELDSVMLTEDSIRGPCCEIWE